MNCRDSIEAVIADLVIVAGAFCHSAWNRSRSGFGTGRFRRVVLDRGTNSSVFVVVCIVGLLACSAAAQEFVISDTRQVIAEARTSFEQGDAAKGREHLARLLEIYRQSSSSDETLRGQRRWASRLVQVAYEYLRASELREAMRILGEVADLDLPPENDNDDGLAAATGALHRQLALLEHQERFDLLYRWTMPDESRRTVRRIASIVPNKRPPNAFARVLGERPSDNSFQVASVGDLSGLFSSAWMLVTSANEAGRLRGLVRELASLVDDDVPNAEFVLTLAEILPLEGDPGDDLKQRIEALIARVESGIVQPRQGSQPVDLEGLVLAAAASGNQSLTPCSEQVLTSLIECTYGSESYRMRAFLRLALATVIRHRLAGATSEVLDEQQLRWWSPSDRTTKQLSAMGCVDSMWLAHEDHILHLGGPDNSVLFFRYPLTGEFEFSCETQDGGRVGTEGGLEYCGLGFEDWSAGRVFKARGADQAHVVEKPSPYLPTTRVPRFHRVEIHSTKDGFDVLSNGHPLWRDRSANLASPWLGLRSFRDRRPAFRNLKLVGKPTIPREVRMSDGDTLRGWRAGYFGERLPSPFRTTLPEQLVQYDWFLRQGEIHGVKLRPSDTVGRQSYLEYARPLHRGESVSYEFLYEPDEYEVHPALGRLAFLIEPGGVRLHWITDGDREWTCLPEDNAVAQPFYRKGPKPLPLVIGDWNRLTIAIVENEAKLTLNDVTIYQGPVEAHNPSTFGLYHERTKCAVRVRNVVMRGDWPERLTLKQLDDLAAVANPNRTTQEHRALHAVVGEPTIAANVLSVRRRAATLDAEARYRYLSDWVLPGKRHPGFRLAGDFSPASPISKSGPAAIEDGELVSPALDLVDTAKELGRLEELHQRVAQAVCANRYEQRARSALLFVILIARGDAAAANAVGGQLVDQFHDSKHNEVDQRWPETLATTRGVDFPATRDVIGELLYSMYDLFANNRRRWRSKSTAAWDHHFFSTLGTHKYLAAKSSLDQFKSTPALNNWIPFTAVTQQSRGEGFPRTHWEWNGQQITKLSGHDNDFLMYRVPLRGEVEIECELTPGAWRTMQLMVAGTWVGPYWDRKAYVLGNSRKERPRQGIAPQMASPDEWARYRAVVRDGACTTYLNGRELHVEQLPAQFDPWLAIRGTARSHGAVRDLRISGNPTIPDRIRLATSDHLPGWVPYFKETVGAEGDWRGDRDPNANTTIVGVRKPGLAGTFKESLLYYHRPVHENGTIDYEFFYEPGKSDVHPAIDRLAFLIEPSGVAVHWITDGKFDRTFADPANRSIELANRRGQKSLPLKPSAWNRLRLTFAGDTLQLALNEQLIYERELEVGHQRTFGLFHYADQTESRVRNIVWRGDWPKSLPPIESQELAAADHKSLEGLEHLAEVFRHDFVTASVPTELFAVAGFDWEEAVVPQPDGLHITPGSRDAWIRNRVGYREPIYGDFDATLRFADLTMSYGDQGTIGLNFSAIDDSGMVVSCARTHAAKNRIRCSSKLSIPLPTGKKQNIAASLTDESSSGCLRLVRRGDTIHALIAHGESTHFRYIGTQTLPSAGTAVQLEAAVVNVANGSVAVVLKEMTIRSNSSAIKARIDPRVGALNQYMLGQKEVYRHNFSAGAGKGFVIPGEPLVEVTDGGLRLRPDSRSKRDADIVWKRGVAGDFDVATNFRLSAGPGNAASGAAVELSVAISGEEERATLTVDKTPSGTWRVIAEGATSIDSLVSGENRAIAESESIDGLRIIRVQQTLFFLYSDAGFFRLLGRAETGGGDVKPGSIKFRAHSVDGPNEVLLKSVEIKASKLDG